MAEFPSFMGLAIAGKNEHGGDQIDDSVGVQPGHESTKLGANPTPQGMGSSVYDVYGKSAVFGEHRSDAGKRVGPFPYRGGSNNP